MRDQVVSESEKLTDAQWNFKAAPGRWSVGEVVEHLALSESLLFDLQQKTAGGPEAPAERRAATKGKDETIMKAIPDRTEKAQAPEPLQPGGRLGTRAEILAAFKERRAKTIGYASTTKDDLRARVATRPLGRSTRISCCCSRRPTRSGTWRNCARSRRTRISRRRKRRHVCVNRRPPAGLLLSGSPPQDNLWFPLLARAERSEPAKRRASEASLREPREGNRPRRAAAKRSNERPEWSEQ